ncbi:MAG TPA: hypothetical protein VEB69_09795 [Acidimicrobiia bacterium]|nr:hypothetical protein [Acidimicrobiia bacterium]
MRTVRVLIMALMAALAVAACSDAPENVEDAVSSLPSSEEVTENVTEVAQDVQTQLNELGTAIENSEAAEDLQTAWSDVRTEVTSAISSFSAGESIDTAAIETQFDEFQTELEAMGDDVGDEVMTAWNELRSAFEQLTS